MNEVAQWIALAAVGVYIWADLVEKWLNDREGPR